MEWVNVVKSTWANLLKMIPWTEPSDKRPNALQGVNKTIVIVSGYSQSGKDTLGAHLVKTYGFTRFAFADELKDDIAFEFPNISRSLLDTHQGKSKPYFNPFVGELQTVRHLLISYGQYRRSQDVNYWVNRVTAKLDRLDCDKVIITDWRFPNEFETLKKWSERHAGWKVITVRIDRHPESPVNDPESENALDDFVLDHRIKNPIEIDDINNNTKTISENARCEENGYHTADSLELFRSRIDLFMGKIGWTRFAFVDVDEVLLQWTRGFAQFLKFHHTTPYFFTSEYPADYSMKGWIQESDYFGFKTEVDTDRIQSLIADFNSSGFFLNLHGVLDAETGLEELKQLGFVVILVTSCVPPSAPLRSVTMRATTLYGKFSRLFSSCIMLPLGTNKVDRYVSLFPGGLFVDDSVKNVTEAIHLVTKENRCKFDVVLFGTVSNTKFPLSKWGIQRKKDWQEVVQYLRSRYALF
jgi:hypothetical protein